MATKKKSTRKFGPAASKSVEREMKAMEQGKLKSGRSGKKVTSRKQAIAIGLSEARKEGAKVPAAPGKKSSAKKSATTNSAAKKTSTKKASTKKTATKKTATKKTAGKKTAGKKASKK